MANEEGRIHFVEEESLPRYRDLRVDDIYCFDLRTLTPESTQDWIAGAQHTYAKRHPTEIPTVVVLGTFDQLRSHGYALVKAGAILWEKPDEFDQFENDQKIAVLESEFSYPEEERRREPQEWSGNEGDGDWLSSEGSQEVIGQEDQESIGPHPHHQIYVDPPYQLGSEDFERLMDRMRMSDDDPRKDD